MLVLGRTLTQDDASELPGNKANHVPVHSQYSTGQLWDPPRHTMSQELQQPDGSDDVSVLFKKFTVKKNKTMLFLPVSDGILQSMLLTQPAP